MTRVSLARFLPLAVLALAACSGGGSTGDLTQRGDFLVITTEPNDNAQLFLNDSLRIDFNHPIDLDSVDLTTVTFRVFDQIGNPVAEPVAGQFSVGTSPGDAEPGRRLVFAPRLPTNDAYTNGGFRPGRTYEVQLVGGNRINGTVLRDTNGRGLAVPRTFRFTTADGTTPASLFRNTASGGPRRTTFQITPTPEITGVVLNKLGAPPVELRLGFDQPLNPSSVNVPVAVETSPELRSSSARGRVFLEYNDFQFGDNWWIPAEAELESNTAIGSVLVLRPLGVLPNNATIRVVVENSLEDISGESNVANVAYQRVFATFQTRRAYEQQFDGVVLDFLSSSLVDQNAAFGEPMAEVGPGYLKAGFAFEGSVTGADFEPTAPMTVLNTDFTLVTPKNGSPFNVSGGVFNFRNVKIPANKAVIGQGTNPMVWLVSGNFEVAGTLSVRGGDGEAGQAQGSADVPRAGGAGACGGGDGGDGSPKTDGRDFAGAPGNGPAQLAGMGGLGGTMACAPGCSRGSGGGGGSFATQGDPHYKQKIFAPGTYPPGPNPTNVFPVFQQQTGIGGQGCIGTAGTVTRVLEGALPGPTVFVDARKDNDFWGVGVRLSNDPAVPSLRITGELAVPVGGGGGGGGGDTAYDNQCGDSANFQNDYGGGGGGGGGGVLVVKALGRITIRDTGTILADGGSGGEGDVSGLNFRGGGGGGGAGGMVVLMSATGIDIYAKGSTYTADDYQFSISADGGICVGTAAPFLPQKYPATGAINTTQVVNYDSGPRGGFGGLGIVQLMAPPGDDNADSTNTKLDDNIRVFNNSTPLNGAAKAAVLGWRGYPNVFGQGVDDDGNIISQPGDDNAGDIRPNPVLLPTPFANTSRIRSVWLDTGATARRGIVADDGLPRGVVLSGGVQTGPSYEWEGVRTEVGEEGYVDYDVQSAVALPKFRVVVPSTTILTRNANATYLDRPAYRVKLSGPVLGNVNDRLVQYEAELLDIDGDVASSHRILSHTADELVLSPEDGALDGNATRLRVSAKFYKVITGEAEGLGPTYNNGGVRVPQSSVRIGFAFHTDPKSDTAPRYPADGSFVYDLYDPAVQEAVRAINASYVKWDILFDTAYRRPAPTDDTPVLNPEIPLPELHFLRLPFRF